MGKFNTRGTEVSRTPNTVNRTGAAAYAISDAKVDFASMVLSSMLNGDKAYQSDEDRQKEIFIKAQAVPGEFLAKAMVYTRQEGNLRSVSHLIANALVENHSGKEYLRSAIKKAIVRPDDMTEMAALWFARHPGKMLPNSMRRTFKSLLEAGKWDSYQLNKYKGDSRSVKLKDIIKLTHPKDKLGLYKGIIEGTLKAPQSLETKLASGQSAASSFEEMLRENRLGYMAAVKNIRNALESGISDEVLDLWVKMVSDPKRVMKSRMLPFRFIDAWDSVKNLHIDHFKLAKVKGAFNKALIASAHNLDFVNSGERMAIILDESGSMSREFKLGLAMAAVLYHAFGPENIVVYFFSSDVRQVDFANMMPLDIMDRFRASGGATYFDKPLQRMTSTNTRVDKIVIFTDMQLYGGIYYGHRFTMSRVSPTFEKYLTEYKNKVNRNVATLFWDLRGYGSTTPAELRNDVLLASGFSDKLLAVIPKLWRDPNALVREIEEVQLSG